MKKARPDWQVDLHEQNAADDTFGFGVVFSDDTLDEFLSRDPESYEADPGSLRLLGRRRDPLPWPRDPLRRQRLLRHLARAPPAGAAGAVRARGRRSPFRDADRPGDAGDPFRRFGRDRRGRRRELADPRALQGGAEADRDDEVQPVLLDGIDPARWASSTTSSAKRRTGSSARIPTSTSSAARPGSSRWTRPAGRATASRARARRDRATCSRRSTRPSSRDTRCC